MVDIIAVVVERAINYFRRLPARATSALDNAFNLAEAHRADSIILFNHAAFSRTSLIWLLPSLSMAIFRDKYVHEFFQLITY